MQITEELMAQANSVRAFETLRKILNEIGWGAEPDVQSATFYVDFGPPHAPVADALAAIAGECLVVYINFGVTASTGRRDELARFIARANWGLIIGNFEMDFGDGHVRFKSSVDFSGGELTETLVRNAILAAMNVVETYADALKKIIVGEKDALEAIKDTET